MHEKSDPLSQQEGRIKEIREHLLRPIADKFGFPIGSAGSALGMPTVLCLGNHSSGKSTFVNHLAGDSIQDTGVAPTDDSFTLITYGAVEETMDGRAVVTDPQLPYRDLEQFGKPFLDHLRLKRRPIETLKNLCIIDSPGMIDHAGEHRDSSRGYDFKAVVRAFAETADLVVFFFDPDKPGTTGESLRIITESLNDSMYKLLIVFNKVDTFEDVRDFARTYGALCWNLSRVVRTKDMPHIYCTFVPDAKGDRPRSKTIELTEFEKSTRDLKTEISRVGERRRTNMVGALLDSTRSLQVHATVCQRVGWKLLVEKLSLWTGSLLLTLGGAALAWYARSNSYGLAAGVVLAIVGIALAVLTPQFLKWRLQHHIALVDKYFRESFQKKLLSQQNTRFLEGLWESVRPRTVTFLNSAGPRIIPGAPVWPARLRKLDNAIDKDIPDLLKSTK
ncbi:dynamin family protein [Aureliella helgolandensis]|uniref:GTPase Era n=1 Tax=Aureliella helgolandensis TaxID=2527968 RepID=A0A518FZV3_9BACT|nr:dynamin family protein [Aureliella helgolandensis]QDV21889.1 GTPase Era [Aureliella helgolandensis]